MIYLSLAAMMVLAVFICPLLWFQRTRIATAPFFWGNTLVVYLISIIIWKSLVSRIITSLYISHDIRFFHLRIPARGTKGAPLRGACIISGAGGGRFVPKIDRKREQIPQKDRFVPKKQRYSEQTLLFYLKVTEKFEFIRQFYRASETRDICLLTCQ